MALTQHLLNASPVAFRAATRHPFLRHAGAGSLPSSVLLSWLTQDRLYALGYVSFIGTLLSKIALPVHASRASSLEWRITDMLIDALANIRRELGMFEDVLRAEFGWGIEREEEEGEKAEVQTRAYLDLFAGASAPQCGLLLGLTLLWSTEKCYLEAWRFARAQQSGDKGDGSVLQTTLIPNWTSDDFEGFVNTIGKLVDELAEREAVGGGEWLRCEEVWEQVLWAEKHFWPDMEA